jgi:EAL domain-containing protein (putative c-di-GMP-specific phosphodiesterase class I)
MSATVYLKRLPSIRDILRTSGVVTHFQPILSARAKSIVGLEALSRGQMPGEDIISPTTLFRMAAEAGVTDGIETLCRQRAVENFSRLTARSADLTLFMNLHIAAGQTPFQLAHEVEQLVAAAHVAPGNVAIEILEAEIEDMGQVRALVNRLRSQGFLIVLDDVGAGFSNLDRVPLIKPDLLKVDRNLITHVDTDYHKRGTLKSLVDLGRKIGALVVAEGVETEDEAMVTLELGADLLQGYFLGHPRPVTSMIGEELTGAHERVVALAKKFRGRMVEKINERKLQHGRFGVIVAQILGQLEGARIDEFDDILAATVQRYPSIECVYVLDHAGVQLTETVGNPAIRWRAPGGIFRPAPKGADHSLKEYYFLLDMEPHRYTTEPYVSLASGSVSQTISSYFREGQHGKTCVLCVDVLCD